jgi:ketosteroid isomerase-like protein
MIDQPSLQTVMEELRRTQQRLQRLEDRQAVLDCVNRYCRALDRHDKEMLVTVYHPDATDHHGSFVGPPQAYADWIMKFFDDNRSYHQHCITTHSCEIDGDTAHAESYVVFASVEKDGKAVRLGGGRYIDRLERRDGEWRIAVRQATIEWRCGPASTHVSPAPDQYPEGTWDKSDLSYRRPLELPAEVMQRRRA